ncbi:LysR family transcriptional regulator [Aquella oligotrophica]|uniref:HTH lysR-type domain-containing protein n=1 Tax=Aquella oligotrophica TaxID=2067065 RepID=A0A2I7N8M3_9NEIS|nr:LysR family transcriptional regulator [Aquella oligotrophica]AUR52810.1 hypothetical protein CUN60_11065 [Aquella oligotrophica]
MLDDLSLFIKIVECGNFTKAANVLNIYQSKISRRMNSLEEMLGVQLFKRNVKEMELTEHGLIAYNMFKFNINSLINRIDDFNALSGKITGRINVILPPLFANRFINHRLNSLINEYPDLELNISYLVLNEHDLNSFVFDLALSRIPATKPSFQQSVLFKTKLILCASKEYLEKNGSPADFSDILKHRLITIVADDNNHQLTAFGEVIGEADSNNVEIELPRYNIIHNSSLAAYDMVKAGTGLTFMLEYGIKEELENGDIVRLLPDYHFGEVKFYLIQSNHETNSKLEIVKKFLRESLTD